LYDMGAYGPVDSVAAAAEAPAAQMQAGASVGGGLSAAEAAFAGLWIEQQVEMSARKRTRLT